ncbi:MAG: hypothetical protein AABX14_00140 [Candidatus Aenigmatarchaeota archaeon]
MDEIQEQVKEKRKDKWFDVWASIEALAVEKHIVESALKKHIEKMKKIREILVYEEQYSDTLKVENPMKDVKEGHAQLVKIKFMAKDFITLINVVMIYGPSSIEIMSPNKKELSLSEAQNIVNALAGVVHQFAAAGIGGIVITPDK